MRNLKTSFSVAATDVLRLQDVQPELRSSDSPGLTSNLSIICKQQSTISIAICEAGN